MGFLQHCRLIIVLCGLSVVDGTHLTCLDCPPTASPAPTESPAPSPSPSETPTMSPSQSSRPTLSYAPSGSPSVAPTRKPSDSPTESPSAKPTLHHSNSPTESPAPSPSPSEAPTMSPSMSSKPTLSSSPSLSMNPSDSSVFLISSNNEIVFEGLHTLMSPDTKEDFEEISLGHLSNGVSFESGETEVKFESVRVTKQFVHDGPSGRRLSGASLHIVFDVAAFVRFQGGAIFNFSEFVSSIFEDEGTVEALNAELVASSSHFGMAIMPEATSTKSNTSIIFASVGISFVMGGLVAMMWLRNRKQARIEDRYDVEIKPTESYDSASSGNIDNELDNESELSYPSAGYPISQQFKVKSDLRSTDLENHHRLYSSESFNTNPHQIIPSSMYRPAMLETESNIEIPITPMTNYDASHFSPKDMEDEEDSRAPSHGTEDDCGNDVDLSMKETFPRPKIRNFGFGRGEKRKSIQSSNCSTSGGENVGSDSFSAQIPERKNDCNNDYSLSAQSSSTITSLFSRPTKLLKNVVWKTSGSSKEHGESPDQQDILGSHYSAKSSTSIEESSCTRNLISADIEQSTTGFHEDIASFKSNATTTIEVINEIAYLYSQDQKTSESSQAR